MQIELKAPKDFKWLHSMLGALAIFGAIWLVYEIGGQIFESGDDKEHNGLKHLADMVVFGLAAFFILGLLLYAMRFTILQAIFLPWFDELLMIVTKWKREGTLTQPEAILALALALATGLTILGVLIALSTLATPLG